MSVRLRRRVLYVLRWPDGGSVTGLLDLVHADNELHSNRDAVIAAAIARRPLMVRDGESGWLVPFEHVPDTTAAMGGLLPAPQRARAMGLAAREDALLRSSLGRHATLVQAVYHAVPGSPAGHAA